MASKQTIYDCSHRPLKVASSLVLFLEGDTDTLNYVARATSVVTTDLGVRN